jgi:hypothetical protein
MCGSPKNELFQPVNGNQCIGAGTPTLMPIIPALKWCWNCQPVETPSVGCIGSVLSRSQNSVTVLLFTEEARNTIQELSMSWRKSYAR